MLSTKCDYIFYKYIYIMYKHLKKNFFLNFKKFLFDIHFKF